VRQIVTFENIEQKMIDYSRIWSSPEKSCTWQAGPPKWVLGLRNQRR